MKVNPFTVGPIVGETTGTSVRLWGRGGLEFVQSRPRRVFGVAQLRRNGDADYMPPKYFKLNPNFDLTGVVVFNNLNPETAYEYRIGWFFSDLDLKDVEDVEGGWPLDWSQAQVSGFRTASQNDSQSRSFVFGSCRYLLRLFGGSIFDNRGDKTFRSITNQIRNGQQTDQLLMIGDQIYADDLNIIRPDQTLDEYNGRYRDAFSQSHIRDLMARVPTYMTLDDHEIENDWPTAASAADWQVKYPHAIQAYVTYQLSHSPLFGLSETGRITGIPDRFWYRFSDGWCDFFVTDTRTERHIPDDPNTREIMSEEQLDALTRWLDDGSGRVKFIVSSVPFFPDIDEPGLGINEDKWSGFPKQRNELLDFIQARRISRVVFLSGDVHCSMTAELVNTDDPAFKIISIISSPFFQPFHFIRQIFKDAFVLEGELVTTAQGTYEVVAGGPIYNDNNFTRVSADLDRVKVEVYSRKGKLVQTKVHEF
jgi:alkaline phosphatase D